MTDFLLSLGIHAEGTDEALAKFKQLSADGQTAVSKFTQATGKSLDQAIAKWKELGDRAEASLLRQAVAAEKAAHAVGKSNLDAAESMSHHEIALGRVERSLESYVVRATGANEQTGLLAAAFGHLELGSVPMIGILGGLFAVTKAYELLTAKTREAKEAQDKALESLKKLKQEQENGPRGQTGADLAVVTAHVADLRAQLAVQAARIKAFGGPNTEGGAIAAKVAAPLQKELDDLLPNVGAGATKVAGDQAAYAKQTTADIAKNLAAAITSGDVTPAMRKMAERMVSSFDAQIKQLRGDPTKLAELTDVLAMRDPLVAALHPKATTSGAGDALAKRMAEAYQRELTADLKSATKIAVANLVADAETTYAAQHSVLAELTPDPKALAASLKESLGLAVDMVARDPMVLRAQAIAELGKQLGQMIAHGMADGLVNALDAGFQKAFSGSGAVGFLEGFGQSILASLGTIMEQMGAALLTFGLTMTILAHALKNPVTAGPAAIGVGIALMALGAALNAAVNGKGSSGASAGSFSGGSGLPEIIDRGVINPDSYSSRNPAGIQPRPNNNYNVTIIGPNDPSAQRAWDELQRKSQQRGSLVPA